MPSKFSIATVIQDTDKTVKNEFVTVSTFAEHAARRNRMSEHDRQPDSVGQDDNLLRCVYCHKFHAETDGCAGGSPDPASVCEAMLRIEIAQVKEDLREYEEEHDTIRADHGWNREMHNGRSLRECIAGRITELRLRVDELHDLLGLVDKDKGKLRKLLQTAEEEAQKLRAENERLQQEVEILRRYGNKDCTAMADEALAGGRPGEDEQK
jgi:hypothetical protein